MPRLDPAVRNLMYTLDRLKKMLRDPALTKEQERSLMREFNKAALSLSKIRQLELHTRIQDKKASQPVVAKEQPPSHLDRWLEEAENVTPDNGATRNILGGSVDADSDDTTDDGDQDDDDFEDEDSNPSPGEGLVEGDVPKSNPSPGEGLVEEDPKENPKEESIDPEILEAWSRRRTFKQQRADRLRQTMVEMPGMRPPDQPAVPAGEGRFGF